MLSVAARSTRNGSSKEQLSDEEAADALDWFLADVDETDLTHTFEINVGSASRRKWVKWTVKPVDMDRLRRIRRSAQQGNRRSRITGNTEFDEVSANVAIVVEGTVYPDLIDAAKKIGTVDPAVAIRSRFRHKPGLLTSIAAEIMAVSGYDDEDVREVDAARG